VLRTLGRPPLRGSDHTSMVLDGLSELDTTPLFKRKILMAPWLMFVIIGTLGGIAAGLFGIGGGIIIVPALIYWAGFSQHVAIGTSLAVLLPPIGLAAVLEYYRHGNIDVRAAVILAVTMFLGSWLGAYFANQIHGQHLRLIFGLFVCCVGVYIVYGASKRLGWF
jgi:uncharacterized membrane protein YfcA